jgi:putative ABC transport system permease protein
VFNLLIIVIAAISLIVGGIGIMNIMLATVTERTREIGIRRAVGASRRTVLAQFLAEASMLSLTGGIIGLVAGIAGALAVEAVFGFTVAFDALIAVLAVCVSVAIGIGFGLYPAWKAARMDPVEALRT